MSVGYRAIAWNPAKRGYDLATAAGVLVWLGAFAAVGTLTHPTITVETLLIRGLGSGAFALLHLVLSIGPLCRLSPAFLPLLYNRRHLGVTTFLVGIAHGTFATVQFHGAGNVSPLVSLLGGDPGFQTLGLAALAILFLMAATSHDFWLAHLTAPVWKGLHLAVYAAYALLVAHVAWGALQSESTPVPALATAAGVVGLVSLHLVAATRERRRDVEAAVNPDEGWIDAGPAATIPQGRARVVCASGERVAIFRHGDAISAISNVCRHQNGPLGEGKVIDGCVTCPWHGYQYRPEDGTSPAPFTEAVPTFRVRVTNGNVWLDPRALPPGTPVPPARIGGGEPTDETPFYVGYAPPPQAIRKRARRLAAALIGAGGALSAALAATTGPFGPGVFEYGIVGRFEGTIEAHPYPVLVVDDAAAESPLRRLRRLPLVAPGKHGADPLVAGFDGRRVTLRGKRVVLGNDVMIELVPGSLAPAHDAPAVRTSPRDLGTVTLAGEIVDSKCFFGVMNPGRLEVHRACAIRCIAGGIPPILYVRDRGGAEGWVFLLSSTGRPVNDAVLHLVARPVAIEGRLQSRDGRFYLYADPATYRDAPDLDR